MSLLPRWLEPCTEGTGTGPGPIEYRYVAEESLTFTISPKKLNFSITPVEFTFLLECDDNLFRDLGRTFKESEK